MSYEYHITVIIINTVTIQPRYYKTWWCSSWPKSTPAVRQGSKR